jgi:hypothetical protein
MERNIWKKIDRYSKKIKAINFLGGECECCGENNFFKLEFHHLDSEKKEFNINELKSGRWSIIELEIKKCILVCRNCHTEIHYNDVIENRSNINKKTFLEFKNEFKCEKCGYNKNTCSLDFHHIDPDDKEIVLSQVSIIFNSIYDLTNKLEIEIDKCKVLCKNCHRLEHSDVGFFEKYKKEIIEKSKKLKEKQFKIDRDEVKKMYKSGFKQVEIAKYFNAGKGTISGIIKELSLK